MRIQSLIYALPLFILISCGGGSSSTPPAAIVPTPPVTQTGPTWTQGVFADEGTFKNRCEAPRSGSSPWTGNAYPDVAGSTTEENFWLRSWSNRTYLWYSEITDRNPAQYSDRLEYFDLLKTARVTASGNPVDKFHFTSPTDDYEQRVTSGSSASYGARFQLIRSSPPRQIIVAFVEPNSPAEASGLLRGDEILEIDGEDAINGGNTTVLNNGLFPQNEGESHTFIVRSQGSSATRTINITSATVTSDPIPVHKTLTRPNGNNVAYLLLNTFGSSITETELFNAFTDLSGQGVTDLVLDLRYNGGGFLALSSELGYMIAGPGQTNGRTFETLFFNDKFTTVNPITNDPITPTPFYNTTQGFSVNAGTSLPSLNLNRVFILSTASTCSASEALINGLRGIDVEVILVGTTTCGKPYGFYATDNCGSTYFTIQFGGKNEKGFGDYSDGFSPNSSNVTVGEAITGCVADDDYSKALGDETEGLFSTALHYLENGSCPATNTPKTEKPWGVQLDNEIGLSLLDDPRIAKEEFFRTSRILNNPSQGQ